MYGIGDIIENSNAYEALQCKNIQRSIKNKNTYSLVIPRDLLG